MTRFPALFTTGMHGTEHRNRENRTLHRSAPRQPFSQLPDQCFRRAAAYSRLGPDARNDLSLSCNGYRFRDLHSRVDAPGLLLRFQRTASATRSTFWLRHLLRLAPVRVASLLLARCSFYTTFEGPLSRLPLPLWDSCLPPGSKRSAAFVISRPAFRLRPISLRSLSPVSITSVSAADQRSRFATFPEACCSSKPLGTNSTMPPIPSTVNPILVILVTISSVFISLVFRMLHRVESETLVDKTRPQLPVSAILARVRRLVIRPGAIGDFILSLPALECLKTEHFEVWSASRNLSLVRFADRVRSIASTGLDLLSIADPPPSLLEELRGFDSIISWYGANRPDFRALTRDLALPFTFFSALPPEESTVHATDFYLSQVRSIVPVESEGVPRIPTTVARSDFAVIHPFSGSPKKNWPLHKFQQVARKLERQMPVRWCSGPDDPPLPKAVRIDDLYELACWLAQARLYIGNDSGITHLAAAVDTPVLALFGPTNPAIWAPRGPHVRIAMWPESHKWQPQC